MRRLPLRVRLIAGFAVAMSIVLAGAGAFVYLRVRYALDLRLNEDLTAHATLITQEVGAGRAPAIAPGIEYQIVDATGHLLFASTGSSGAAWLITTTFPEWQQNQDCEDGDWRALNFERAPFDWGGPVEFLNENCTEAGGGWRDKSLGVWRL